MSFAHHRSLFLLCVAAGSAIAQDAPIADPAQLAFEQERWQDAISEYREILEAFPEDRLSLLRIAQAERELGRHEAALATLDRALENLAPEAMVHLERARNFASMGRAGDALAELEAADHLELRARLVLEDAAEFDGLRDSATFQRVYNSVRARVFPCERMPKSAEFDFWLGNWEVRGTDGTLLGHNTVTREPGGCAVREQWRGNTGSTGTSLSFYVPSRDQWRHVWVGSSATQIELSGGLVDGEMQMEGTIEYLNQDLVLAFRANWSVGAGGRVRQRLEQFDLVTQSWQLWFDGIYRRID